jgi:elongation factor Ts
LATEINAKDVMKLRTMTGVGMMDCKEALKANDGNMDAAVDYLRKKGITKAAKKAERVANEGQVASFVNDDKSRGCLVEVNCETDFVAKTPDFQKFMNDFVQQLAATNSDGALDQETLAGFAMTDGKSAKDHVTDLVAKLGENITLGRAVTYTTDGGFLTKYIHQGGKLGVLVEVNTDGAPAEEIIEFAKDVAMQIAAAKPQVVDRSEVPQEWIDKEKEIYREQALNEGKPEKIIDRIAEGKLNKYFSEVCLLEQPFVKDTDVTIGESLSRLTKETPNPATIRRFARIQIGQAG